MIANPANLRFGGSIARLALIGLVAVSGEVLGAGTSAGTDIDNVAQVSFEVGGTTVTKDSNTVTLTVAEVLDVAVVLQSPQISVAAGDAGRELLFTLTNTGNSNETFTLSYNNDFVSDPAVDFNPVGQTPALYFDTDGSLDFSAGDQAYNPGANDPSLDPDESVNILIVNDIPTGLSNANRGRSALSAVAATGSGAPGTVFAGAGTDGVDAIAGTSSANQTATGEYVVFEVKLDINKSASVLDPFGQSAVIPGAIVTYTVEVEVTDTGTATNVIVRDDIPGSTTYVDDSLTLNGAALSDALDTDAGELDTAAAPGVVIRLGDLTQASGTQSIQFDVRID